VTIAAGGSVTFRNDDDRAHTVTANDGAFDSGAIGEGGSWKRPFKQAGTFGYLCAIHPEMTGKVVVEGTGGSGGSPAPATTPKPTPTPADTTTGSEAEIQDFSFAPPNINVPVGSTVNWRNAGAAPHTVSAEDGSFDSEMIAAGGSWARTFDAVGTFRYVCSFHPEMEGVVEVTAAAAVVSPLPTPEHSTPPAAAAVPPIEPLASSPPEPATAPVAARGGLPDGELFARIAIVGLLLGGAVVLFARTVRGSANRAIGAEPPA
jgi:plastocyanin